MCKVVADASFVHACVRNLLQGSGVMVVCQHMTIDLDFFFKLHVRMTNTNVQRCSQISMLRRWVGDMISSASLNGSGYTLKAGRLFVNI